MEVTIRENLLFIQRKSTWTRANLRLVNPTCRKIIINSSGFTSRKCYLFPFRRDKNFLETLFWVKSFPPPLKKTINLQAHTTYKTTPDTSAQTGRSQPTSALRSYVRKTAFLGDGSFFDISLALKTV